MGRVAVGKTSIKLVIFEGHNPKELLKNPLSPTRGIETSVYPWIDLEIGLFDVSGQELAILLEKEIIDISPFEDADVIIYVLDHYNWEKNFQNCIEDIKVIYNKIVENSLNSQLILFFHKIDIFDNIDKIPISKIKKHIKNSLKIDISLDIYFTSIVPEYNYNIYNAFFEILGSFSEEIFNLKNILDDILKKFSKCLCIITELKTGSIFAQSMTADFNSGLISDIYYKLSKNYLSTLKVNSIGVQLQSIESELLISNIIKDKEEIYNPIIRNIITFSETLDTNDLSELMKKIRDKINKYYMKKSSKSLFTDSF